LDMANSNPSKYNGRLQDKVAIVTGASSGIGRAISLRYAHEGAHVVVADLYPTSRNPQESRPTHEVVQSLGRRSIFVEANVTSSESVDALIERAVQDFGRVDIMCNNAGAAFESGVEKRAVYEMENSTWQKSLDLNCNGVFYGTRAASRQMLKQDVHADTGDRGWIINTASIMGHVAVSNACAYVAAKHCVMGLTKASALDLAPHRVHVNAICPGFVESAFASYSEPVAKAIAAKHPFGERMGNPEDIAGIAVFLASSDAKWIQGTSIIADGAYTSQ